MVEIEGLVGEWKELKIIKGWKWGKARCEWERERENMLRDRKEKGKSSRNGMEWGKKGKNWRTWRRVRNGTRHWDGMREKGEKLKDTKKSKRRDETRALLRNFWSREENSSGKGSEMTGREIWKENCWEKSWRAGRGMNHLTPALIGLRL
jgi:hypothetical protein